MSVFPPLGKLQYYHTMQNMCCFHLLDPKKLNGLPWRLSGEESACFDPSVGETPWRREWQPTPLFLPGKSHEQKSLAGYSLPACEESERVYQLSRVTHTEQLSMQ